MRSLARPCRSAVLAALVAALAAGGAAAAARAADDWADEARRLIELASLRGDMIAAEIGAGRGGLTVEIARHLARGGRLFSTEIDRNRLDDIRRAITDAGLANVTVVEAGARDTNLPEGCCDVVYMREVYHHFDDGAAMAASIHRALKAGGRLAIIDFPERGPRGSICRCIPKDELIRQVTGQGFALVSEVDRWTGIHYLVLFVKR
jgi:ubiquinone/menaquinone biosynthesis C-methylase UbiE